MKMTLHIDDALLDRVVKAYDLETKTEAIHMSLKEMDRLARLKEYCKNGLGLSKTELVNAYAEDYDPDWGFKRMTATPVHLLDRVAEEPAALPTQPRRKK